MLQIPDIQYEEINLPLRDPAVTADCLWDIYCVIKKVVDGHDAYDGECRRVVEYLYAIGVNGMFEDEHCRTLVVNGITNPKWKRAFPALKYLFELEQYGFQIHHIVTGSGESSRKKMKIKDVLQFRITYVESDYLSVMRGLKLFADACFQIKGDPFYSADIRILFSGHSGKYVPPIEETFSALPEEQKKAALMIHEKLEALGCSRNLEREYMLRYVHPKNKGKTFATIYCKNQFWFPDFDNGQDLSFKFNLRHIQEYTDYLEQCTEPIQLSVIHTAPCYGCDKHCGGIRFTFRNVDYVKCPSHIFRFTDLSPESVDQYLHLLDLEHQFLAKQKV